MSAMPYCYRLVGGWPLHVFLVWLESAKFSKLISLCVTFILFLGDPNSQRPCEKPKVLPPNFVTALALDLWTGLLLLNYAPAYPPAPWIQNYGVIHQVGWWYCTYLFNWLRSSLFLVSGAGGARVDRPLEGGSSGIDVLTPPLGIY